MPEEAQNKQSTSPSTAGIVQQGYESALQKTAGIINNFVFSNETNRQSIVNNFKDNLLSLDRDLVKKIFDGAGAIKNKPDETFSIPELPGVAIPKKIVQELKILPKKFFEEYDVVNRSKNEIMSQAKAASIAEGAETQLDAAKAAMFGKGFGQIGTALGSMVGMKPVGRKKSDTQATKQSTEAKPVSNAEERKQKIVEKYVKPVKKSKKEQDLEELDEKILSKDEKEKKEKDAKKSLGKVRQVVDVALYQNGFNEILDNLEKNPDPFANNGAAFYGIRKLKQEVRQADKKDPRPELKNIYNRLDELGSEYRTSFQEQKAGKDGKARLISAVKDVRAMSAQSLTKTDVTEKPEIQSDIKSKTSIPAAVIGLAAAPLTASAGIKPLQPTTRPLKAASSATKEIFTPKSTDIKARIGEITKRESDIGKRLDEIKNESNQLNSINDKDPNYEQAFARTQELSREEIELQKEFKNLYPQRHALENLQTELGGKTIATGTPSPEQIKKSIGEITKRETGIGQRLDEVRSEAKQLRQVSDKDPKYEASFKRGQELSQEEARLVKEFKNTYPQRHALESLLSDIEKKAGASIGKGAALAGLAGAAVLGTQATGGAVLSGAGTEIAMQGDVKSRSTIEAAPAQQTPAKIPTIPAPKKIQAQADIKQTTTVPLPTPQVQKTQAIAQVPKSKTPGIVPTSQIPRRARAQSYGTAPATGLATTQTSGPSRVVVSQPNQEGPLEISISPEQEPLQVQDILEPTEKTSDVEFPGAPVLPVLSGGLAPLQQRPAQIQRGAQPQAAIRGLKKAKPRKKTATAQPISQGYKSVGPQEIKPPIGKAMELGRAMNLGSKQAAGRQAARAPEGLELSTGGFESQLGGDGTISSALPAQDQFIYNPVSSMGQPAIYAQRAPGAAYETEEPDQETIGAGGEIQSELERLGTLEARKQQSRMLMGQLLGPATGIGEAQAMKEEVPAPSPGEFAPEERDTVLSREIPRMMKLESVRESKIKKLAQAKQKIAEFKAQIDSVKKGVQQFRDLKNVSELLAGISGWTLLALWIEWNLDLINKRIAAGRIPFLEKPPAQDAAIWEKGKHWVKDGVTIFADVYIPVAAIASFFMPLIITAIITLSFLGAAGAAFLAIADFFGISLL